ncbi:uncharacterized protein CLUP02_13253 [Colletotrichum lupini]|uniref:Uncharacterized protein n=1 Tax=Colletotrichum lupini TaxID=145971 RepID=A0A9Q8T1U7_9PEZI|nr:uncharacterized protein CLUP02_13253 [Colletotrichum lupini]UQC87734.1 hypothetical protein CLUP02_13253 [Colletotrichum lupini]
MYRAAADLPLLCPCPLSASALYINWDVIEPFRQSRESAQLPFPKFSPAVAQAIPDCHAQQRRKVLEKGLWFPMARLWAQSNHFSATESLNLEAIAASPPVFCPSNPISPTTDTSACGYSGQSARYPKEQIMHDTAGAAPGYAATFVAGSRRLYACLRKTFTNADVLGP